MRPLQPQPAAAVASNNRHRSRRRQDLILSVPQRGTSLAVPLPLPPTSNSAPSTTLRQTQQLSFSEHDRLDRIGNGTLPLPPTSNSAPSTSPRQNQQLGFSELDRLDRIGSGSGGTVYKAIHRPTGRVYALKVIYGNHEESVVNQIYREIKILRDVNHPNVVKCHDMFDRNGEIQLLLEYMDGGSLEGKHFVDENHLSNVAYQILSGIAYLHGRRIVHRDIKPSNLLINSRNIVKIADFGVGRMLDQTMDPCNSSVGTIAYMSPERINTDLNHGKYDGYAGDIWSLGVSILEFYLGRFPFPGSGHWLTLMNAIMAPPPEAPPTASREFRNFIACCLQREVNKRWPATKLLQHPFILKNAGGRREVNQNLHQLLPPPRPLS